VRPIVKWAGGKRSLLSTFEPLLPDGFEGMRLLEPFAGGAAMFFGARSPTAVLSDINAALIETYEAVRDDVHGVVAHLSELAARHSVSQYYAVRDRFNQRQFACAAELGAAFLYLNKTCFNGLYRVNRAGEFNVPIGRHKALAIVDVRALTTASVRLRMARLSVASFESVLDEARSGDFVYLDPPYVPRSGSSNFSAYAATGFSDADQARLCEVFRELSARGIPAMASNSDTPRVRALYDAWPVQQIWARRSIGAAAAARGAVPELVIRNYA
jgi:DNA adenine methylase